MAAARPARSSLEGGSVLAASLREKKSSYTFHLKAGLEVEVRLTSWRAPGREERTVTGCEECLQVPAPAAQDEC